MQPFCTRGRRSKGLTRERRPDEVAHQNWWGISGSTSASGMPAYVVVGVVQRQPQPRRQVRAPRR
jgi:hypothetical protein